MKNCSTLSHSSRASLHRRRLTLDSRTALRDSSARFPGQRRSLMNWLAAALAFAVTMLALSTVVTTTVETIHRILGLREDGLRSMLQHLYDAAIAPHVDRAFPNGGPDRDEFLQCMTTNRAPVGDAGLPAAAAPRLAATDDRRFLSWIWGGRRLGSLSVDDFMARLGASRFGDAVAQLQTDVGSTAVDAVVQDI